MIQSLLLSTALMSSFSDAKLVRVYDGDTFFVRLPGDHRIFTEDVPVRIKSIDTPELRGARKCEKRDAKLARDQAALLLGAGQIDLHLCEREKYFRMLCIVRVRDVDVATWMLAQGLAVPYEGETKKKWRCLK
jgi:micrococcal nuclease